MGRLLVASLVLLVLAGCAGGETAEEAATADEAAEEATAEAEVAACAEAARLADASPWPPPESLEIRTMIEASDNAELMAALEAALETQTDHELVVRENYRGVAPSEAQDIVEVCEQLGHDVGS